MDKEQRKEYYREYYKKNKERILQLKKEKEQDEEYLEKRKEYHKKYYEDNKESMIEYSVNWKKENREAWNAYQRKKANEYYYKNKLKENEED